MSREIWRPLQVKTEKSKQKRLLRFLDTLLPMAHLQQAWFTFVVDYLLGIKFEF